MQCDQQYSLFVDHITNDAGCVLYVQDMYLDLYLVELCRQAKKQY